MTPTLPLIRHRHFEDCFVCVLGGPLLSVMLFGAWLIMAIAQPASAKDVPHVGGRFMLENHLGEVVTDQTYRGKFMLLTFGYTSCPDICPTNLVNISDALEFLGKKSDKVVPLFVTVDPKRDTVERLHDYISNFDPRIIALTGPQPMIDSIKQRYNVVSAIFHPKDWGEDDYTVDHTASIFLMSPKGEFLVKFAHGMPPKDMAKRISEFMD